MTKTIELKERILKTDFSRFLKRFVLLAIAVVLAGGAAAGIALNAQGIQIDALLHEAEHAYSEEIVNEASAAELSNGAEAVIGIYAGICLIIFVIYWITVALWLYKRAVISKMNGLLWLMAGLAFNVVGAVLFCIVRSFVRRQCSSCGAWQLRSGIFCAECGTRLNQSCPKCGQICGADDNYCSSCGEPLDKTEAGAEL